MLADVLIITAAKDEDTAIRAVSEGLAEPWSKCEDVPRGYLYDLWQCSVARGDKKPPIRVILAPTPAQREHATAAVASVLISHFHPFCVAMSGVCAGRPGEVNLGDVIIADKVWKYDAGAMVRQPGATEAEHYPEIETYQLPMHWKAKAESFACTLPADAANVWGERPRPGDGKPWRMHVGGIATGKDLVRDPTYWERLAKTQNRKILGIDMEGSAIGWIAEFFDVRRKIIVKGAMDHADPSKTDKCRLFAARAAAEVLVQFLRAHLDEDKHEPWASKKVLLAGGAAALVGAGLLVSQMGSHTSKPHVDPQAAKGRLEILRDFVPRIGDKTVRFSERAMALAECINAGVFRDAVAFEKAAELMEEAPESSDERRAAFPQLVEVLAPMAPAHLAFIETRYSWATDYTAPEGLDQNAKQSRAYGQQSKAEFWWYVFQKGFAGSPDAMMDAITKSRVDFHSFKAMYGLCANLPTPLKTRMEAHASRVVRALVAIAQAESTRDNPEPLEVIRNIVYAESDADMLVAAEVINTAKRRAIVDPHLAKQCLLITDVDASVVPHQAHFDPERPRGRESRLYAAAEYVVWACKFKAVADVLEEDLVAEVVRYAEELRAMGNNWPDTGNGNIHARTCVKALKTMNSAMHGTGTPLENRVYPAVVDALERIAALPDGLLDRVNMKTYGDE